MDVNFLLDKAKEMCNAKTDTQLSIHLKVSKQRLSHWRNGANLPDPIACEKIAEITGIPLARVLGVVGEARAISTAEKAVWRKLAQAACLFIAMLFVTAPGVSKAAEIRVPVQTLTAESIEIMRS